MFSKTLKQLYFLSKRNITVFFRDKISVFFSFLSPIIVLLIFLLFIKNNQVDTFVQGYKNVSGVSLENITLIKRLATKISLNFMFCGLLAVSTITVSLGASSKIVDDKTNNISYLLKSSPVKKWVIVASYILATFTTSILVNISLYLVIIITLSLSGALYIPLGLFFLGLLVILVSVLSASTFFILVVSVFKSQTQFAIFSSIVGTLAGFLVGAYIPIALLPIFIQKLILFIPGTYSVGLLKKIFMPGVLDACSNVFDKSMPSLKESFTNIANKYYSENTMFFGKDVKIYTMFLILVISATIFFISYVLLQSIKRKNK